MRDLVRARLDAVHTLRRTRQQLSGFLLRQGRHYGRPAWTMLHRRWLAGLKFEQAIHYGGSDRRDTAWTVGVSVLYSVWQNFGLTFDIQRTALNSSVPQTGFTNNVVSLGVSYVY